MPDENPNVEETQASDAGNTPAETPEEGAAASAPTPPASEEQVSSAANTEATSSGTAQSGTKISDSQFMRAISSRELDQPTSELLLKIYQKKRVLGQLDYYRARVREFDQNSDFMVAVSAFIMAASSFVSAIGALANSPVLALITAILPAFAALASSFKQLYQWDKQSALYRDATLGLEESRLLMPDDDVFDPRTAPVYFPRLVSSAEEVFLGEISQWGQIAMGGKEQEEEINRELDELSLEGSDPENPVGQ